MNPNCPKCDNELSVGRQFYLRSVTFYYHCNNGCGRFSFGRDNKRHFYSEARLKEVFDQEHIFDFSI